ncbi:phosphotransferase family protein [Saccharomonospora azurea]|uniref:phosphotransferase family protein n=1 Tax=Saccharomonospora azurea TaxID=40988 RepID=UPI00240A8663|nr:aminoglycoside 3'-phosphotransferase/choline kinase family protein [Saccharomonospora azurea]
MTPPPLAAVLAELSLDLPTTRFVSGSLPVHAVGDDLVLKFYPSDDAEEFRIEAAALTALEGRLSVQTPRPRATGTREGWHYVLMTRVPGVGLDSVWDTLTVDERRALCGEVGAVTAELHAVTEHPAPLVTDWTEFVRARRDVVVEHHRQQDLAPEWLELVPDFVDGVDLSTARPVFLHTELLREHVFVRHDGTRWTVSGLVDFEPAMVGAAEYEFVAASVYLAGGDRACWHAFLHGYGLEPDVDFARRCLAYTLLHRYSTLRRYLTWLPVPGKPSLDELARLWFGADVT